MKLEVIQQTQVDNRNYWIKEIILLSDNFGADSERIEQEISDEIDKKGINPLIGHLRLCGAIPEKYGHGTSEEKLYSKYTDVLIAKGFSEMGITSIVLKERADTADVECVTQEYSFVADAKAFRLSRTAKNQKDIKIQAMDNWKKGKPYATVICPVYQLPSRVSQIYYQSSIRAVLILTYTHLVVFIRYAKISGIDQTIKLLHTVFKSLDALNPSKDSPSYWQMINSSILEFDPIIRDIWIEEKQASAESIYLAKEDSLHYLASERERIMKLKREEAIKEVMRLSKIDNRIKKINSVKTNGILSLGY
ncbi:HindIII family type II restriction endonuclease [bacterium]|nr:HindIII family type II restriction endonuclease [bacterium]